MPAPFPEAHPCAQLAGLRRDVGVSKVSEMARQPICHVTYGMLDEFALPAKLLAMRSLPVDAAWLGLSLISMNGQPVTCIGSSKRFSQNMVASLVLGSVCSMGLSCWGRCSCWELTHASVKS